MLGVFILFLVLFTPIALMLVTMAFVVLAMPLLCPAPDTRGGSSDTLARLSAIVVAVLLGLTALLGIVLAAEATMLVEQSGAAAAGPEAAPAIVHPLILLAVMASYGLVLVPADQVGR